LVLVTDCLGSFVLGDVDLGDRPGAAEIFADLAERVQEAVIDQVWAAWPACLEHGHPLEVATADGRVRWACPDESVDPIEVGSLG
jgi:hypothetical protein